MKNVSLIECFLLSEVFYTIKWDQANSILAKLQSFSIINYHFSICITDLLLEVMNLWDFTTKDKTVSPPPPTIPKRHGILPSRHKLDSKRFVKLQKLSHFL
jgi:hypothetical protein